jgi:cytidylate kinase
MDKKFVIAITRTCGSGATSISKILGERLGINVYDRNLLSLASEDSGINEELFARVDEHMKQSLLYRISKKVYSGELIPPDSNDFTSNDNLFNYQAKVLKELAENESYICIGRAADYILKDNPNMISVFVCAPEEVCIEREMKRCSYERKKAEQHVTNTDKYRSEFYKYHTGREWRDPQNYDLCINTGKLSYVECVDIIENYIRTRLGE